MLLRSVPALRFTVEVIALLLFIVVSRRWMSEEQPNEEHITQIIGAQQPLRFLVVNGAGANMRGKLDIPKFGPLTLPEYETIISAHAKKIGVEVEFFQSNIEGEIINKYYLEHDAHRIHGAVFNPAFFTVGYRALVNAVRAVRFPTFEAHVGNPFAAGTISDFSPVCKGVVIGAGVNSYCLALDALKTLVEAEQQKTAK